MPDSGDALRRWRGMFCLTMAAGMLIWGQTVLEPLLKGIPFLIYWAACFLFTIAAIIIALQDIRAVRKRVREEHKKLLDRALSADLSKRDSDKEGPPS